MNCCLLDLEPYAALFPPSMQPGCHNDPPPRTGGGWGSMGGPRGSRQKMPGPPMGIRAGHAELYEDEPTYRTMEGKASERRHGRGKAASMAAAEEAEEAVLGRMGGAPERRGSRGRAAAAAAEEAVAAAGGVSGVPGERGIPRKTGKGMSIPPLGTALGGLGMGGLAAAQASRRGAAENEGEGGNIADEL
eukprot:286205-Pelagomonas_calceolata.AAC.3